MRIVWSGEDEADNLALLILHPIMVLWKEHPRAGKSDAKDTTYLDCRLHTRRITELK